MPRDMDGTKTGFENKTPIQSEFFMYFSDIFKPHKTAFKLIL